MRKIFLTSGLVVCMACPAFADFTPTTVGDTGNGLVYPKGQNNAATAEQLDNVSVATGCVSDALGTATGPATLYANWTKNTYTVTYNPGTAKSTNTNFSAHTVGGDTYGDTATFDENYSVLGNTDTHLGYSQTGYHFVNWRADYNIPDNQATALSDSNTNGGTQYSAGATPMYKVTNAAGVQMYAQWAPNVSGQITLDAAIRPGNDHNAAATYNVGNNTGDVANVSPAAVWSVYETALYGSLNDANSQTNSISSFSIPSRTGYEFNGFYDGATPVISAQGAILDAALTSVSSATGTNTWYAHWTASTIGITYTCGTAQGTSGFTSNTAPAPEGSSTLKYDDTFTLAQNAPGCVLPGYHFKGWNCGVDIAGENGNGQYVGTAGSNANDSYTVSATGQIKVTSAVVCDAIWEQNTVVLQWNKNGADSADIPNGACTYDEGITLPDAPSKAGYTFEGWTVTNPNE